MAEVSSDEREEDDDEEEEKKRKAKAAAAERAMPVRTRREMKTMVVVGFSLAKVQALEAPTEESSETADEESSVLKERRAVDGLGGSSSTAGTAVCLSEPMYPKESRSRRSSNAIKNGSFPDFKNLPNKF